MDALRTMRRMWEHAAWADALLLAALESMQPPPEAAWREYSHVLGATSVWLDRLRRRPARLAVWPVLTRAEAATLAAELRAEYTTYLESLTEQALDVPVPYVNSAGQSFATPVGDILLQVMLHGQYHRGKVNLLLRQAGLPPVPTDHIAFARGVPAATTPPRRG
jgi:uncharacterized damage-inducible protein DinB